VFFEITHVTRYTYDRPVFIEPHTIRLRPRTDIFQRLVSYELSVDPAPEGLTEMIDPQGNAVTRVWFLGLWPMLVIRSSCTVETLRPNPFDYIVLDPDGLRVPMAYGESDRTALAPYLDPPPNGPVREFAEDVLRTSGGGATAFLQELCTRISWQISHEVRRVGDPLPAAETLARGEGACRDRAVLFVEACRAVGVAARFVTGYEMGDPDTQEPELHAWGEVYLNGAGWRGYDPSQGLAVADHHVAISAAAGPAEAAPTFGTYRGTNVLSTLTTAITVRVPTYGPTSVDTRFAPPRPRPAGTAVPGGADSWSLPPWG
jgi:transglutaminase-like putative cysteine protease